MTQDILSKLYRKMLCIRRFEERVLAFFEIDNNSKIFGTTHVCIGQEAVAVGACAALREDDYITSTHRGHGHFIAKGGDLKKIMSELFAKQTGYSKGRGGTQHMGDMSIGHLGSYGVTSSGIPIATGAALSIQYRGSSQVAACFFGDGAANEGVFHECLNMASLWKLPVIFICENNLYAMSVPFKKAFATPTIGERAKAYNMKGVVTDGMDVLNVKNEVEAAVAQAREGQGPTLIEFQTYRFLGHSKSDRRVYRSKEEEREWLKRDPLVLLRNKMEEQSQYSKSFFEDIEESVIRDVEAAITYAEHSAWPKAEDLYQNIYAP